MVLSKDLKFSICFGLIVGALISICTLCFASETVDYNIAENLGINPSLGHFISSTAKIGYFKIEPGYVYTLSSSISTNINYVFSDDVPAVNVPFSDAGYVNSSNPFVFTYSDYNYLYFDFRDSNYITITREPLVGMTSTIDNLAYTLSFSNVWQIVGFVVPILAIAILFVLGFYLIRKLINKIKRKKGGV